MARLAALAAGLTEKTAREVACNAAFNDVDVLAAMALAKRPLMLPAPVERIVGVNAIPTRAEFEAMNASGALVRPRS